MRIGGSILNSTRFFPLFETADIANKLNSSVLPTKHLKKRNVRFNNAFTLLCNSKQFFVFLTEIHSHENHTHCNTNNSVTSIEQLSIAEFRDE